MEQSKMKEAFIEALGDPKVIEALATSLSKKIIQKKSTPSNLEQELVKKHVVFSQEGSETGTFMTSKEISTAVVEFNEDAVIRPRIFGKALIADSIVTKDSKLGRVYLVEGIYEEINGEVLDEIESKSKETKVEAKEDETSPFAEVLDDLENRSKKEIKNYIKENGIKISTKGLDKDEMLVALDAFFSTQDEEPSEPFVEPTKEVLETPAEESVDVSLLISAVNGFDDMDDYKAHLDSMSHKALVKHINAHKMQVICEDKSEEEIVQSIVSYISLHLEETDSNNESEEKEVEPKKKKKKKK